MSDATSKRARTEAAAWFARLSKLSVTTDALREFRRTHPEADLQLSSLISFEQIEAVRSGQLDAGFVYVPTADPQIAEVVVDSHHVVLAMPRRHPVSRLKKLRLRDLVETDFVWFPRRQHPANYDRLLQACARGGLTHPRIVQEAVDQATMLSLVACGLGVAFVADATRWRCPKEVVLRQVDDLRLPLTVSCIWRKDNGAPLMVKFLEHVRQLADDEQGRH